MIRALAAILLVVLLGACTSMGGMPIGAKFEGGMLVNSAGMTLYTFDRDVTGSGKSACNAECAASWPPLKAAVADFSSGQWSIVVRDDGSRQWAYRGKPVYLWIKDQKPGDKSGDGINTVWHIVPR